MQASRIGVGQAYERVKAGEAILVCGYEDDEKYKQLRLEMSIPFAEFQKKLSGMSKDQEIIFYCA